MIDKNIRQGNRGLGPATRTSPGLHQLLGKVRHTALHTLIYAQVKLINANRKQRGKGIW